MPSVHHKRSKPSRRMPNMRSRPYLPAPNGRRTEIKHLETFVTAVATDTGGYLVTLLPAQGTDVNQRIGNKVEPLRLKGIMNFENRTAPSTVNRILILRSKGAYSATATDYLAAVSGAPKIDTMETLYDKEFPLQNGWNGAAEVIGRHTVYINVKLSKSKQPIFNASTATAATQNGLALVLFSNAAPGATSPVANGFVRFFYQDY